MKIDIIPVAKPRMTKRDVWAQRPAVMRYRAFCDELRLKYKKTLPAEVQLIFYIPMPISWSKKRRVSLFRMPHQQKPDIDNLCKSVMDALSDDDAYIHELHAMKFWDYRGTIEINDL